MNVVARTSCAIKKTDKINSAILYVHTRTIPYVHMGISSPYKPRV